MSKIHVSAEDVKAHPELAEFEGNTIEASDFNKIVHGKNVAPQEKVEEEKEDAEVEEKPKAKAKKTTKKSTK